MSARILHVAKVSGISGAERHLLLLLPALRDLGFDVRFVLLHEDEAGAWDFASGLTDAGISVEDVRLARTFSPLAFKRLAAVIRRRRPDLLHTHLVHADFYGLTAGKLARVPVLASTKHGFNAFRDSRLFARGDRAVGSLADLHIAISGGLADYLAESEGFARGSFEVVHYGLAADPPAAPYAGSAPRFAIVGRLVPIKGHSVLFEAFARVLEELPAATLDVAGAGPLDGELKALAGSLGIAPAVRFLGYAPGPQVMEESAVVVVPSFGEGFGMVALEAMERGRAVVASAVGGLPEILEAGRTGLLVPAGNVEALGQALIGLGSDLDRARALGAAGRARAVERFTQERCTERTVSLYEGALARRRPSSQSTA